MAQQKHKQLFNSLIACFPLGMLLGCNSVEASSLEESINESFESYSSELSEVSLKGEDYMKVIIEGHSFDVDLLNNQTVDALLERLPLTIEMDELNGNEIYKYLDFSLPTNPVRAGNISAGDIKLYGNNCLVIFYESFDSNYSYTDIGHIDGDISSLIQDSNNVTLQR